MRVRIARPTSSRLHSISYSPASSARSFSSSTRGTVVSTWTRMKNRPVEESPNCLDSVMFPPRRASVPVTAWTIPGRSGQDRDRTRWAAESVCAVE